MNNNSKGKEVPRREEGNNSEADDSGPSWWTVGLGVAAGVATVAGGIYMLSQLAEEPQTQHQTTQIRYQSESESEDKSGEHAEITVDSMTDAVSRLAVSCSPTVNNLNSLLNDIHVRYIAIKSEDFSRRYNVFKNVFDSLHRSMKAVDPYYERYSSRVQFRTEEFNVYIVIGLPVNIHEDYTNSDQSDIVIEPKRAGFVQLRAGAQYLKILLRDGPDVTNRQAYLWLDDRNYILRSKFFSWFQSVVDRALSRLQKSVKIDGTVHRITTSCKDGAYTLWITNSAGFRLDVDLIPTLKFPEERWLGRSKAYRDIPAGCHVDYWMVFSKLDKFGATSHDEDRSWHVDMHDQEKKFMHNSYHLRQSMRLLKKLRDAQQMVHIENNYIETLFLWKSLELPQHYWQRDVATVFKDMLKALYEALAEKKICFFWKKSHNLIEKVPENILKGYANKLLMLVMDLENDCNYMSAAEYLLTSAEYTEYNKLLSKNIYYK